MLLLQGKERLLSQFEVEKREMTSQLEAEKAGQSALASQLDGSKTEARATKRRTSLPDAGLASSPIFPMISAALTGRAVF